MEKEYESAHAFARKKELAQKYGVAIFHHFYCTDDGKGLVDCFGHIFHKDYRECIGQIGLRAPDVCAVADWMNGPGLKTKFGSSQRQGSRFRGNCRSYEVVRIEDTQNFRAKGILWEKLCGVNDENVAQSHWCYAFLPDDDWVWVRELSCPGCVVCVDPNFRKTFLFSNHTGCSSSDVCGK